MTTTSPAIECERLSVTLGANKIIKGVDFGVSSGVVCGLLGPNGSGKTTLLKALGGQIPHEGVVRWHSKPRRDHGVTSLGLQSCGYHPKRKTKDHVKYLRLTGCVDTEVLGRLTEQLSLTATWNHRPSSLSFGQRQALNVLGTLAARARIYLLDEPFAGLDARRVAVVRDRILELRTGGATVVVTSHDLAPVEGVLERVLVLDRGALCFAGPREEFVRPGQHTVVEVECVDGPSLSHHLAGAGLGDCVLSVVPGSVTVSHPDHRQVIRAVVDSGVDFTGIVVNSSPLATALADRLAARPANS